MSAPPRRRPPFDSLEFIVALAEGGDRAQRAGRNLIRCFRPLLRARFFTAGVSAQDIDDLVADVLTTIVSKASQVRNHERFEAWVYSVAGNVLNRHWTAKGRAREILQQLPGVSPVSADLLDETDSLLDNLGDPALSDPVTALCLQGQLEAFRTKHPQRHACIELLVLGHDAPEIALLIGRTEGATRQFISQCCAVVMRFLAPCLESAQLMGRGRGRATTD